MIQAITAQTRWIDQPVVPGTYRDYEGRNSEYSYDLAFAAIEAWARREPRTRDEISVAAGRYLPTNPGKVTIARWAKLRGIVIKRAARK